MVPFFKPFGTPYAAPEIPGMFIKLALKDESVAICASYDVALLQYDPASFQINAGVRLAIFASLAGEESVGTTGVNAPTCVVEDE